MTVVLISVHVTRPGERADELLAAVAAHLHRNGLSADDRGRVTIRFYDVDTTREALNLVVAAIHAAGDDADEYLHVNG